MTSKQASIQDLASLLAVLYSTVILPTRSGAASRATKWARFHTQPRACSQAP